MKKPGISITCVVIICGYLPLAQWVDGFLHPPEPMLRAKSGM